MFLLLVLDPTLLPVLILTLDPTLCPALGIAQKCRATWRLWYWRPVMGQIGHVGFVHAFPLQLLSSRQLSFSCSRRRLLARSVLSVRASFIVICGN
jgi:hypothetical protein